MRLTPEEYASLVKKRSPNSPVFKDVCNAFWTGGLICVIGQAFIVLYQNLGLPEKEASTCASVTLVVIAALLTGFHLYDRTAKFCGAGTLVPITGFANAVVSPAIEFKSEGAITGLAVKIFTIAGPVLVFGLCSSFIYGLVLMLLK